MQTQWSPETKYKARIGGIFYKSVDQPIVFNGASLLSFSRHRKTRVLGVSFFLTNQEGNSIAEVKNNQVVNLNTGQYSLLEGYNRFAVIEQGNGRVWCDLKYGVTNADYELDLSCILFGAKGYPIILHPNRSKFGKANDGGAPNMAHCTVSCTEENLSTAIRVKNDSLYILSVAIENFHGGIAVDLESDPQ